MSNERLNGLLYEALQKNYNEYIKNLQTLPVKEIIEKSYETAYKEDIISCFESDNARITLSDESYQALIDNGNPLDAIYDDWLSYDGSVNEMLCDSVNQTGAKELESQRNGSRSYTNEYQLLSRLKQDCDYYLGAGGRQDKHLWADTPEKQIAKMRELYDKLPEKPEWLSKEDINNYEKEMVIPVVTNEVLNSKSDGVTFDDTYGTWYVIDSTTINGKELFLLESEEFGDEAACIIADKNGKVEQIDVWNGFDDYKESRNIVDISYSELKDKFRAAEKAGVHITGYIVFIQDCFTVPYTEGQRTYRVSSKNKAFQPHMGGYSIYASCVDGSDQGVHIEQYMKDELGGKDGWTIERCYIDKNELDKVPEVAPKAKSKENER